MPDDLMAELLRLRQYARRLSGLLSAAQASSPQQVEGADSRGTVRMALGPDGLPTAIRVSPGWERKIAPAAFGGAVLDAFGAAARKRMAVWTQALKDSEWPSEVARLQAEADGRGAHAATRGTAGVPPASVPAAFQRNGAAPAPRAAVGSIIFSWAGLAMVAEDCGANAGMIWAAVALLSACLTAQASQMAALHGQAVDETSFPGGHWPQAVLG